MMLEKLSICNYYHNYLRHSGYWFEFKFLILVKVVIGAWHVYILGSGERETAERI